jgi:tripeptide aminopeptidase
MGEMIAMAKQNLKKTAAANAVSNTEALRLVLELMAIPGRSGEESAVVDFIRNKLLEAGLAKAALLTDDAPRRIPQGGQVGNLILNLPGTVAGPRRMLAAHLDTVPICVGSRPVRKAGRVVSANKSTGLGADDRAGAAVLLATAISLLRAKTPHPPLTLLWTVQEEAGLLGARYVQRSKLGRPRLGFNFDGGSPALLKLGATGGYRMTIDVRGIASHAGNRPEEGISAIAIASLAIAGLVTGGWHGLIMKDGRAGTSNVGMIQGGEATNVVTEHVRLRVEARSHDAKFRERIVKQIRAAFEKAATSVRNSAGKSGRVQFEGALDYDSFRLAADDPSVAAATAALEAEGLAAELGVTNGGLDANWLTAHGIPTVTLGCGQRNIHTVREELVLDEFHLARRIALRLATGGDF